MAKHVLVIADIDDDDILSLEKARDVTLSMQITIEIIKFIQPASDSVVSLDQQIIQAKKSLSSTIKSIFDPSTDITSEVVINDDMAEWVANYCNHRSIDLVIKGGHRSESLFHTSSDWALIRQLRCPILIASHAKWNSKANILLTLDLSTDEASHQQLNALILSWGETFSQATNNELHALYSIPIAKTLLEFDLVNKESIKQKKTPAAQQKMQQLLAKSDMGHVTGHITAGPPDRTIPREANLLNSDLVIIGSVGREGMSSILSANTAKKVLQYLRTDCLIIKLSQ